jgi:menaquinone-dependent protoporphyrinogen oxidase
MRALIAYATANGSTRAIAEALAVSLAESGPDVDLREVSDVASLNGYDAVVLGSPLHDGAWLPEARSFLKDNRAALSKRPLWLFSVGAVGATSSAYGKRSSAVMRKMRRDPRAIIEAKSELDPKGHHVFAGVLEQESWSRMSSRTFKLFGGTWGDHRDWEDIRAWASAIGRELTGPVTAT